MDNADLFLAAALVWFHGDFERIKQRIDDTNHHRVIEWRTDSVTDFRGNPVPASAERLVRWDAQHPNAIFNGGFIPRYAAQAGDPLAAQHVDLNTYVNQNTDSIFVSTARYYRQDNRATRWTPRNLANGFEYEVFAFGGIDVNLSLGYHHRYWNQREIAFPGGIRSEFIRTAREYDDSGRVVRIWVNGRFDIEANGPNHRPRLVELPDPVCGFQVPVRYWFGPDQHQDHHRELRDVSNQEDVMREEGDPAADALMDGTDGIYPVKFLSEGDAPVDGQQYAINIFGTSMALTCVNSTALVLDNWQNKTTQHFRCTMYDGYMGFICAGAGGGSGRYLGFNSSETLVCKAYYQRDQEHIILEHILLGASCSLCTRVMTA